MNATEIISSFIPSSPFSADLGITVEEIEDGRAVVRLPFADRVCTFGDTVHGGAIATLLDVAAMACAWAGGPVPENLRGATVSLHIEYLTAARGEDVLAEGRLIRRGGICRCDVEARTASGTVVARALANYKVG